MFQVITVLCVDDTTGNQLSIRPDSWASIVSTSDELRLGVSMVKKWKVCISDFEYLYECTLQQNDISKIIIAAKMLTLYQAEGVEIFMLILTPVRLFTCSSTLRMQCV